MPKVSLKLQGELAQRLPGGSAEFEIGPNLTLQSFLDDLDLGAKHYVVILNQTVAPTRSNILVDKDKIVVYPQMAGG